MDKLIKLLLAGTMFVSAFQAVANAQSNIPELEEEIDLTELSCRTLLRVEGDARENMLIFLHGYISGQNNDTGVDGPALAGVTTEVVDDCIDNPDTVLMEVFRKYR